MGFLAMCDLRRTSLCLLTRSIITWFGSNTTTYHSSALSSQTSSRTAYLPFRRKHKHVALICCLFADTRSHIPLIKELVKILLASLCSWVLRTRRLLMYMYWKLFLAHPCLATKPLTLNCGNSGVYDLPECFLCRYPEHFSTHLLVRKVNRDQISRHVIQVSKELAEGMGRSKRSARVNELL